jgi:hypothetical protein
MTFIVGRESMGHRRSEQPVSTVAPRNTGVPGAVNRDQTVAEAEHAAQLDTAFVEARQSLNDDTM